MGSIVIRRGRAHGSARKSRLYRNEEEARRAAAAWRAEGQDVEVISVNGGRTAGWIAAVRRWLGPH
jgi:predicted aminopeptidase